MMTVRVDVEVRPLLSVATYAMVSVAACVVSILNRVHCRAIDVGRDAEVEVGLRAGDLFPLIPA
jgi:hypothetical protein